MKEIKCPKCQSVFQVDEADYASIVSQVKNAEFNAEIKRRIEELERQYQAEQRVNILKSEQTLKDRLSAQELEMGKKENEIEQLKAQIRNMLQTKQLELGTELAKKNEEIMQLKATIAQSRNACQIAVLEEQRKSQEAIREKENRIVELTGRVNLEKNEAALRENSL